MKEILIKSQIGEMSFNFMCDKESRRINAILNMIEKEFNTSMGDHPELRKYLLDTSNFIKRLPSYISEIVDIKDGDS